MCIGTVTTGSEEIKQCEIITILGDRVRAGKVPMSVIDVAQSVFGPGYSGLFIDKERHWRMWKGVMTIEFTLGFIGVCWEVGWGVVDTMISSTALETDQN